MQRGPGARLVSVAAAAAAAASVAPLLLGSDHHEVTRAAAGTQRVGAAQAGGIAIGIRAVRSEPRAVKPAQAEVTVTSLGSMMNVPRSFLGISTEYWALPHFERRIALFERVLSLVHGQGEGPLVLRIGGDSADHSFWDPSARTMPHWVFRLTPAWLRRTRSLVQSMGVRLILDLNLVTGSASRAAQWARAAERKLPRGSIAAFEIGNEPDIYSHRYWLAAVSRSRRGVSFLPSTLSTSTYTHDFRSYARALAQVAPRVALIGPALAHPGLNVSWTSGLIAGARHELGIVSAHRYPLSACVKQSSPSYPTIARLLGEPASAGMARTLGATIRLAHRGGLPFRLTELNSVTCGGRPGVSDAFATALWAPDALFELLRSGVDGVNMHVRADAINAAFTLTRHGLGARPLLYGLILFARALGPDARMVHLRLHASRRLPLKMWAVRVRGGVLHVLMINKGDHDVSVHLQLPATGPATVERLLAPSASSCLAVTLDGQQLGPAGSWLGQPADQTITPGIHGYELMIPRFSAALLGVHLRPVPLALNARHVPTRP